MAFSKIAHLIDIKRHSQLTIGCLLGLLLSGCTAVGPGYEQPAQPMLSANYQTRDSQLQPAVNLDSWWQSFADPTLDQLVSQALANNLTVQVAVERIVESRVNVKTSGRKLLPRVDMNCELDLFGRLERSQQAAQADLLVNKYSLQEIQQTLVADVATSYLSIRLLQNQIEIVEKSLQLQQGTTTLVSGRADAGVVTKLDAEQTVAFFHRTRADKAALESQLDTEFNCLGILIGESPTFSLRDFVGFGQIPDSPYLPAAGIPTDLIRRRADIRRAEAEVGAATARIGIAKADLYPRLRLSGFLSPLGGPGPFAGNPLNFGGGNDNIEIHESRLRQAAGSYRVTVLDAVKEVEDSMAMYDGYRKQLSELEIALQSDVKAVELCLQRYELGKSDFQRVINVQMQMLEDSQASAEARAKANIQLIKLYKAVGGGWPMQSTSTGSRCAECATAYQGECQDGCGSGDPSLQQTGYQGNELYMDQAQPNVQFQDGQQNGTPVWESDTMQPASSQMVSPPQLNNHSILRTEELDSFEFNPNFGQNRQQIPSEADKEVLTEMFDWDAKDAAVVESLRHQQSPDSTVAPASYFAESPRINSKRNTQKASSIQPASTVWDSEAIKVD